MIPEAGPAVSVSWIADSDGFRSAAENWSTKHVPEPGDDVTINLNPACSSMARRHAIGAGSGMWRSTAGARTSRRSSHDAAVHSAAGHGTLAIANGALFGFAAAALRQGKAVSRSRSRPSRQSNRGAARRRDHHRGNDPESGKRAACALKGCQESPPYRRTHAALPVAGEFLPTPASARKSSRKKS